jgi:PAS domain-containing protein
VSDTVLAVDAEGEVLFSNGVFDELFGPGAAKGTDLLDAFVPLDENGERLQPEAMPKARVARGESFVVRFSIEEEAEARRHFEAKGRPIDGTEANGGVIVIHEVASRVC